MQRFLYSDKSQQHVPIIRGGGMRVDGDTQRPQPVSPVGSRDAREQLRPALTCCCGLSASHHLSRRVEATFSSRVSERDSSCCMERWWGASDRPELPPAIKRNISINPRKASTRECNRVYSPGRKRQLSQKEPVTLQGARLNPG